MAAFAPSDGESVASVTKPFPPARLGSEVRRDAEGFLTVTPKGIAEDFAQDLPDKEKQVLTATQGSTASTVFETAITTAAWKTERSWSVIASDDRTVSPELQKAEATAMRATSITVFSSHVVMLSHPKEVADLIEQAAAKIENESRRMKETFMNTRGSRSTTPNTVRYETALVDGWNIAYREAGNQQNPKLVLLHGFPASSHQYRNLIPALADSFHVVAPDYPGFGNSDLPDPVTFAYTFDRIAEITTKFLKQKGFIRYGLFLQDYGGPVGFRIVTSDPDALEWLIIQNTNAYEEGFTEAWAGLRNALWKHRTPENEQGVAGLLEFDTIKAVYLHGHKHPELISPDNWNMDFRFMDRPNARRIQMDLFYDYRTNVALYPQWQKFLRDGQPKTLIFWGQDDIFFTREGGEAYLRDLPQAEMHRLDSGHFAVEDCLEHIATNIERFYEEKVSRMLVG